MQQLVVGSVKYILKDVIKNSHPEISGLPHNGVNSRNSKSFVVCIAFVYKTYHMINNNI